MATTLFSPLKLRDLTITNRVTVAPMCQYSAVDGVPQDWHLVHLGQFAFSGPGLIFIEATGVEPQGRITLGCTGLYNDATEQAFSRIIDFIKSVADVAVGIQLGHAGRKGSTVEPWEGGGMIEGNGAWHPQAPSAVPYLPGWPAPDPMSNDNLCRVKQAFGAAPRRAHRGGFDTIQVHVAHGYLLHQFLSPITNKRSDQYGGDLQSRMRYPLEIFEAVRGAFPSEKPVMVRLSATDWIDGGWDIGQSIEFCRALKDLGCDMVDVSSGGLDQAQQIITGPGYQTDLSQRIRSEAGIATMTVGQITDPIQAETILRTEQADMVALARGMLWDPRWTWKAAVALDQEISLPAPYARCNPKMRATPFVSRK